MKISPFTFPPLRSIDVFRALGRHNKLYEKHQNIVLCCACCNLRPRNLRNKIRTLRKTWIRYVLLTKLRVRLSHGRDNLGQTLAVNCAELCPNYVRAVRTYRTHELILCSGLPEVIQISRY